MAKSLKCKDMGMQCDWEGHADTEDELMAQLKEHARTVHNMQELPPELQEKAKAAMKDE